MCDRVMDACAEFEQGGPSFRRKPESEDWPLADSLWSALAEHSDDGALAPARKIRSADEFGDTRHPERCRARDRRPPPATALQKGASAR